MEIRVLAPTGVLGAGFKAASLERGIALKPHVIACDGGSTDSGPAYLGSGKPKLSKEATKRDLRLLLKARNELGVPLIIGSCGTSGSNSGVDWVYDIALEIAREEGLHFTLARIYSDQDPGYLTEKMRQGKILPLQPAPPISEQIFVTSRVVGMMGTEPLAMALDKGADVILAGRASDSALYAVVPLRMGIDPGLAWHAAKTIECGASCCVTPAADGLMASLRDDHFEIEPLDPDARVTPLTIAAHTLYENKNPYLITEPAGTLDTEHARYEAANERVVRVYSSTFKKSEVYTIKLEGAERAGYQTIAVGGIRDPQIIRSLPSLLPMAKGYFAKRIAELFGDDLHPHDYDIRYRLYGLGAVMGSLESSSFEPTPAEIGVLITVTAPTQAIATKIASLVSHVSAHLPVPGYEGLISTIAYPTSPPEIERGAVYRFTLNHVVAPGSPEEMFRTQLETI